MLEGFILSGLIGIIWWNLLIYYGIKSKTIYKLIDKNGGLKTSIKIDGKHILWRLAIGFVIYMTLCNLVMFRFDPVGFPILLGLDALLLIVLLLYNRVIINGWLLTKSKPRVLALAKGMTKTSIKAFDRATLVYGFVAGILLSMVAGLVYILVVSAM